MTIKPVIGDVSRNVALLKAPDYSVNAVNYCISNVQIAGRAGNTLDLEVEVKAKAEGEVASLEDLWISTMPVFAQNVHPGLKAKAAFEMRSAVAMYDRTFTPESTTTTQRFTVLSDLQSLVDHFASQPAEQPALRPYPASSHSIPSYLRDSAEATMLLAHNRDILHAILFHEKDEIDRIYAHLRAGKFTNGVLYETWLRGLDKGEEV